MPDLVTRTLEIGSLLVGQYRCAECAERICHGVGRLPGVVSSSCDEEARTLTVSYDPGVLAESELLEGMRRIAVEETHSVAHAAYRLTGLD